MKVKGICGSGILDVLSELYTAGIVLKSGAFNKKELKDHPRFRKNPDTKQPEFVLAWAEESSIEKDIVITQKDVRQIQLAKGALYAGCKLMVKRMGVEKLDKVKIAGAFGTHVDRKKALIMGLFPDCEIEMIQSVGNAAGDGCRAALLNTRKTEGSRLGLPKCGIHRIDRGTHIPTGFHGGHATSSHERQIQTPGRRCAR